MLPTTAVTIRAGRPSDRRAVRELCARIWDDDYVGLVFPEWVHDRRGRFWVALVDGRVAGVAKLTLTGDREAWLHALRVDPRERRKGVATALLEHRLARARKLGVRVARLDTSDDNTAVRRLMRRYRFDRVARVTLYSARARAVPPPRRATREDVAGLWRLIRDGELLHETYTRRRVTRADIADAVRRGRCVAVDSVDGPQAVAIVMAHEGSLRVTYLGGAGRALGRLLRALPGEARLRGLEDVRVSLPARWWPIAERAGYRRRWRDAMLIFEKEL